LLCAGKARRPGRLRGFNRVDHSLNGRRRHWVGPIARKEKITDRIRPGHQPTNQGPMRLQVKLDRFGPGVFRNGKSDTGVFARQPQMVQPQLGNFLRRQSQRLNKNV
jgi:hypothetical protein